MPGYYVHFASCNPKALKNRSFVCGVEAPDILKKYYLLYGLDGAKEKYNIIKQKDMPDFEVFKERIKQKETFSSNNGLHYGLSSNPNISFFWNNLSIEEKKNPFYIGYLWHLLTDLFIYRNLDIKSICNLNEEEALKKVEILHKDWDKINTKIKDTYQDVKLTNEIIDLGVVNFIEDDNTTYVEWNNLRYLIDYLRKYDTLNDNISDIIEDITKEKVKICK